MAGRLEGTKALLLVGKLYEEMEAWYPLYRLREEGADVTVAAKKKEKVEGKHGYPIPASATFDDVAGRAWDLLVLPGGYGPDHIRTEGSVQRIVREHVEAGRPTAAICHAGWLLASAGVAGGRKMTSWPSIRDDLKAAGAEVVDEEVVVDDNLVTSRKPDDLPAFMREVIELVAGGGGKRMQEPQAAR